MYKSKSKLTIDTGLIWFVVGHCLIGGNQVCATGYCYCYQDKNPADGKDTKCKELEPWIGRFKGQCIINTDQIIAKSHARGRTEASETRMQSE